MCICVCVCMCVYPCFFLLCFLVRVDYMVIVQAALTYALAPAQLGGCRSLEQGWGFGEHTELLIFQVHFGVWHKSSGLSLAGSPVALWAGGVSRQANQAMHTLAMATSTGLRDLWKNRCLQLLTTQPQRGVLPVASQCNEARAIWLVYDLLRTKIRVL